MIQEALGHLSHRMESLGDEVHLLDQRLSEVLVFLGRNATTASVTPTLPPSRDAEPGTKVMKRIMALELGQRTVAAGARRALRKAMAAQRCVQERRDPAKHPGKEDPWVASRLKQQESRIAHLDEQVKLLAAHLQEAFAEQVEQAFSASACKRQEATERSFSGNMPGNDMPSMATASEAAIKRGQSLHDIMQEALAEAETDALISEARREADRLRAELLRVEGLGRPSALASAKSRARQPCEIRHADGAGALGATSCDLRSEGDAGSMEAWIRAGQGQEPLGHAKWNTLNT